MSHALPSLLAQRGYFLGVLIAFVQGFLHLCGGLRLADLEAVINIHRTAAFLRIARGARTADEITHTGRKQVADAANTVELARARRRGGCRGRVLRAGDNALKRLGNSSLKRLVELIAPLLDERFGFGGQLANELVAQGAGLDNILAGTETTGHASHGGSFG